jgi:hypothetical protein
MKGFCAVAIAIAAAVVAVSADWADGNKGYVRVGVVSLSVKARSPHECFEACRQNQDCQAWSFHACRSPSGQAECDLLLEEGTVAAAEACVVPANHSASGTRRAAAQGLLPLQYTPLKLGAIVPSGWLQDQLVIMANGLSGHLDAFVSAHLLPTP